MSDYQTPTPATTADVARVLMKPNPLAEIQEHLSRLEAFEDFIGVEKDKWEHARKLVALGGESDSSESDAAVASSIDPELNGTDTNALEAGDVNDALSPVPATATRPTRRDAVLAILGTTPIRTWKLSDVVKELQSRGWGTGSDSENIGVMKTLGVLVKKGVVKKPKTGHYRLVATPRLPVDGQGAPDD